MTKLKTFVWDILLGIAVGISLILPLQMFYPYSKEQRWIEEIWWLIPCSILFCCLRRTAKRFLDLRMKKSRDSNTNSWPDDMLFLTYSLLLIIPWMIVLFALIILGFKCIFHCAPLELLLAK